MKEDGGDRGWVPVSPSFWRHFPWLTCSITPRIGTLCYSDSSHGTSARCPRLVVHQRRRIRLDRRPITPLTLTSQRSHSMHKFHQCLPHFPCRHAPQQLFKGLALLGVIPFETIEDRALTSPVALVQGTPRFYL